MAKVYRLEFHSTVDTVPVDAVSTMHYQTDVPILGSEPSAATVLDEVMQHWSSSGHNMSHYAQVFYSPTRLTQVVCREEVANPGEDIPDVASEVVSVSGALGAITGDRLPVPVAVWINCASGAATRSGRGGFHLPPTLQPSVLTSAGAWDTSTAFWTALVTFCDKVKDVIDNVFDETGDIKPVIYSRTRRGRSLTPYTFDLTTVTPSQRVRWVRRRATNP